MLFMNFFLIKHCSVNPCPINGATKKNCLRYMIGKPYFWRQLGRSFFCACWWLAAFYSAAKPNFLFQRQPVANSEAEGFNYIRNELPNAAHSTDLGRMETREWNRTSKLHDWTCTWVGALTNWADWQHALQQLSRYNSLRYHCEGPLYGI